MDEKACFQLGILTRLGMISSSCDSPRLFSSEQWEFSADTGPCPQVRALGPFRWLVWFSPPIVSIMMRHREEVAVAKGVSGDPSKSYYSRRWSFC